MYGDPLEHNGNRFRVTHPYDDSGDAPWDREDGHGPVSEWTTRDKAPGEMVLCSDRGMHRYYDFQEAVRIARRDGWDAAPYSETETAGQRAHKAAMADYDRLRQWCDGQWCYVGVVVELVDDAGDGIGETESLWGIESDAYEYLAETAHNLADELLARLEAPMRRRA